MAKKQKQESSPEQTSKLNNAGKGIFPRILGFILMVAVVAVALAVLCDINVGRTPEIFGFELDFLI